jgi:TRAP-type C4-dicarboxylate transport system permease small subunit
MRSLGEFAQQNAQRQLTLAPHPDPLPAKSGEREIPPFPSACHHSRLPKTSRGNVVTSPLDPLYRLTAFLAVTALVGIAAIILADVILRQFGGQVKSSDDFAGFALVATGMLGLAPTYRRGDHIRVGLLLDRLTGGARRAVEFACLAFGVAAIGWASWWAGRFVYDSWRFHEVSQGLVPVPLWVPQFFMFFGLFVLLVAMAEDLIRVIAGRDPSYMANAPAEAEVGSFDR